MSKAIFYDRDGIINRPIIVEGKPFSPRKFEELQLCYGIKDVLSDAKKSGFLNIVITNQPDIMRGLMPLETLEKMNAFLMKTLAIDDIFVCPHDNIDNCNCRKPKPGLLIEASKKWNIDMKHSYFIGDQQRDVDAGKNAGCLTLLLDAPYNKDAAPDYRVKDLRSALDIVLKKERMHC